MLTLHNIEQRSEEWYKLRAGKITASNAWKLLQYDKSKAKEPVKFAGNIWTERGRILESEAIELYEKIRQVNVQAVGFVTNDKYPECGASPDGLTDKLIEVKCFNANKHISINSGNIPYEVMAQIQFSLMICELDVCDLVLYNPDLEPNQALKIIEVVKIDKIIQNIISKL